MKEKAVLQLLDALQNDLVYAVRLLNRCSASDLNWADAITANGLLHYCAYLDLANAIKLLLNRGAPLNALNKNSETALHAAAANNCLAACQVLLEFGADVGARNNSGSTALMCAAACGHPEAVSLLLMQGAATGLQDYDDQSALQIAQAAYADKPNTTILAVLVLLQRKEGLSLEGSQMRAAPRAPSPPPVGAAASTLTLTPTGATASAPASSLPAKAPDPLHAHIQRAFLGAHAATGFDDNPALLLAATAGTYKRGPPARTAKKAAEAKASPAPPSQPTGGTSNLAAPKEKRIRGVQKEIRKFLGIYAPAPASSIPFLPSRPAPLDVVVCVEHCYDCASHSAHLWHDYGRYRSVADRLLVTVVKETSDAGLPVRLYAFKSKPVNASRLGALELTISVRVGADVDGAQNGWLSFQVYSKLHSANWPNVAKVSREGVEFLVRAVYAATGESKVEGKVVKRGTVAASADGGERNYREVWKWMARLGSTALAAATDDSLLVSTAATRATEEYLAQGLTRALTLTLNLTDGLTRAHSIELANASSPPRRPAAHSRAELAAAERIRTAGSFLLPLDKHGDAPAASLAAIERLTLNHFQVFDCRATKRPQLNAPLLPPRIDPSAKPITQPTESLDRILLVENERGGGAHYKAAQN